MKHARSDYDCIQPWPTKRPHTARVDGVVQTNIHVSNAFVDPIIPDDEPVFLVRAQDVAAIPTLHAWCEAATEAGADALIVDAVHRHIDAIRVWQNEHAAKVPDAPNHVFLD